MAGDDTDRERPKAETFPNTAFQHGHTRRDFVQSLNARLLARHPFLRLRKIWQAAQGQGQ
jgi:hypothetical protein